MNSEIDFNIHPGSCDGTAKGWRSADPTGKYLFYECFIPFRLVPKATKIHRYYKGYKEAPPRLRGDAIYWILREKAKRSFIGPVRHIGAMANDRPCASRLLVL